MQVFIQSYIIVSIYQNLNVDVNKGVTE